jgi:hypothetical protein
MFASQVDSKSISDAEKFGYLLELVNPKVRGRLSGSEGYKTAWERLKMEYGHNKLVIAAHMEEIIKLQTVRGRHYDKVCELFYESPCKNYDALQTLGEEAMLKGLVVSTLNNLPQVKPDLLRNDDNRPFQGLFRHIAGGAKHWGERAAKPMAAIYFTNE